MQKVLALIFSVIPALIGFPLGWYSGFSVLQTVIAVIFISVLCWGSTQVMQAVDGGPVGDNQASRDSAKITSLPDLNMKFIAVVLCLCAGALLFGYLGLTLLT